MNYNFDKLIERKNTNSLKWNINEGELPMWVADMDFETSPAIKKAITDCANIGVFGYTIVPDEWATTIAEWWQKRHNFSIDPDWLVFCTGVIPAISSIVRKLTTVGENVLVQTPVYNIFFNSIVNNGRNIVENKLLYNNGEYSIDFSDLENKLSDSQTTLMMLCNPQNPSGKIWSKDELEKIGDLCFKYNVTVVSDEIHCDITQKDKHYIPFASVSEKCKNNSITCISPSKAFNIAGLQSAAVIVSNKNLYHKVWRGLNTDEVAEPNVFAISAAIAAYSKSEDWLDELCQYIDENKLLVYDFIEKRLPIIKAVKSDATYLLWLDCTKICDNSDELACILRKETGLWLSSGNAYKGNGNGFLRMNIACPKSRLTDGLQRLEQGINKYINIIN